MTLVLPTSKAQLILMLLFAYKLRSCWCLHTNLTLPDYKIFLFLFNPPSPGIQRWGCKCAQEFSVKRVKYQDLQIIVFKLHKYEFEVVDRGSETQLIRIRVKRLRYPG